MITVLGLCDSGLTRGEEAAVSAADREKLAA